jgi:hypothetical protein
VDTARLAVANLSGSGHLEPLGGAFMSFLLGHWLYSSSGAVASGTVAVSAAT